MRSPDALPVALETGAATTALVYEAHRSATAEAIPNVTLILGHGAGAGQRSPFIVAIAHALAAYGLDIVTFNFPYTEQGRRMPDRAPVLESCYRAVIHAVREHVDSARQTLVIGGKSMGGRIATHVAAADKALPVAGVVLLGYPLHPAGRPDQRRDAHLPAVARPMLFVQGSRDALGLPAELMPVIERIVPAPTIHVVEGGDHSFTLPGRNPSDQAAALTEVHAAIVAWVRLTFRG